MTDFVDYGYVWKLWLPYSTTGLTSYLQLDFKLDFDFIFDSDFSHTCDFEDTNIFEMGLAILMLDAYWKKSSKSLSKFLAFIALKLHSKKLKKCLKSGYWENWFNTNQPTNYQLHTAICSLCISYSFSMLVALNETCISYDLVVESMVIVGKDAIVEGESCKWSVIQRLVHRVFAGWGCCWNVVGGCWHLTVGVLLE